MTDLFAGLDCQAELGASSLGRFSERALSPTSRRANGFRTSAARLSISAETVHKHLVSTFQKTGASTRAGLVAMAFGSRFGIDI